MERIEGMDGVVLAGGRSSRMGRDKAGLEIGGKRLIERQLDLLAEAFSEVVLSCRNVGDYAGLEFRRIPDDENLPRSPLSGIATALRRLGRPVFVLAVDLPNVPPALIAALSHSLVEGKASVVAPRAGGRIQGLCAAWSPGALPAIESGIAAGRLAVHRAVEECRGDVWDEPRWSEFAAPSAFANLNTADDFAAARRGR
jgi:molybdopterin-guanine dinucleotide biosynthesis protein A